MALYDFFLANIYIHSSDHSYYRIPTDACETRDLHGWVPRYSSDCWSLRKQNIGFKWLAVKTLWSFLWFQDDERPWEHVILSYTPIEWLGYHDWTPIAIFRWLESFCWTWKMTRILSHSVYSRRKSVLSMFDVMTRYYSPGQFITVTSAPRSHYKCCPSSPTAYH